MATTAGGLPYVEPSDLVSGWPAVSQDLAEELDSQLAAKAAISSLGATYITQGSVSAGAAVAIDSAFTSSYAHYLVIVNGIANSGTDALVSLLMRAAASDYTGTAHSLGGWVLTAAGALTATSQTTGTSFPLGSVTNGANFQCSILLTNPQAATLTGVHATGVMGTSGGRLSTQRIGFVETTTQYDGVKIQTAATWTGTVRIYGFKA